MEQIKLKLAEFFSIKAELSGWNDGTKDHKGILQLNIQLILKYWVTQLQTTIDAEVALIEKEREELIKKYGTETDGNYGIQTTITEKDEEGNDITKPNSAIEDFYKEFQKLLEEEKEISYHPIKLALFEGITSEENYVSVFKFVTPE